MGEGRGGVGGGGVSMVLNDPLAEQPASCRAP